MYALIPSTRVDASAKHIYIWEWGKLYLSLLLLLLRQIDYIIHLIAHHLAIPATSGRIAR